VSANPRAERRPLDAYHTPPDLASALVRLLPIVPGALAWEPHAGGGAFVRALGSVGAKVTASDVDPDAPALADHPYGVTFVGDFLAMKRTPADVEPDWIVGNPPFKGFEAHIDHALTWAPDVAYLLRLAVMESAGRVDAWGRWPLRHVWVLAERPSFTGGQTDSAAYGFFWFRRGYRGPVTVTPGWSWKGERRVLLADELGRVAGGAA
jgi:hypothetical protein